MLVKYRFIEFNFDSLWTEPQSSALKSLCRYFLDQFNISSWTSHKVVYSVKKSKVLDGKLVKSNIAFWGLLSFTLDSSCSITGLDASSKAAERGGKSFLINFISHHRPEVHLEELRACKFFFAVAVSDWILNYLVSPSAYDKMRLRKRNFCWNSTPRYFLIISFALCFALCELISCTFHLNYLFWALASHC